MCGFYQTPETFPNVWQKPHMCVKNQTGVCISKYRVVLSVFVFEFDKYHSNILPNIYIGHSGRADPILQYWKDEKNCIIFHVCGNSHTHKTVR